MTTEPTDAQLVARAQDGDMAAFETLTKRHSLRVYRVALRVLGDPNDAEDAAQDAFVDAWRHLHRFRGQSEFSTWIYRITVNRCHNVARGRRETAPLPNEVQLHTPGPERLAELGEQLAAVAAAIAQLPTAQRVPLVLRQFEGCSHKQIAEILDLSVPAVKSRLHRARIALLDAMREWT